MSGFDAVGDDAIAALIGAHPLAWLVAPARPGAATPMPLLLDRDEAGRPARLLGHLPRRHPLVAAFADNPAGLFLFSGPNAYITPAWLANKDWGPTWNFAVVAIEGTVTIDEALTAAALDRLVAHMERDHDAPWTTAELGARYETLASRVIGFAVAVTAVKPRFKLGQDESETVFGEILAGLGHGELPEMMRAARA